jgi:hypothetical protein
MRRPTDWDAGSRNDSRCCNRRRKRFGAREVSPRLSSGTVYYLVRPRRRYPWDAFLATFEQDHHQSQEFAARDQLAKIVVPASAIQLSDVFMAGTPDLPSAALRGVVINNSPELLRAIELEISVSDCNGDPLPGEQPCHVVGQVRRRTEDVNVPAGQARTFQIFPLGFGPLPVTEKAASAMSRRFDYRITSIYSDSSVSQ